jgi:hypothetical protein
MGEAVSGKVKALVKPAKPVKPPKLYGSTLVERIFHKQASPLTRLMRGFDSQKTADSSGAMQRSLGAILSQEGYSDVFRAEALAIETGDKTDLIFDAAFTMLAQEEFGPIQLDQKALLEDIRLLHDLLSKASQEEIYSHLWRVHKILFVGSDETKAVAAPFLARMCNNLALEYAEAIWTQYCEASTLKSYDHMPGTAAAAADFMKRIEGRIIEVGRSLKPAG